MDLLACGSPRVSRLPKDFASVAAGRTLPTHSCATAPDLDRLPAFGELFSCAIHYGPRCRMGVIALFHTRLVEGRHLVEEKHSGPHQRKREHRAGALAKAQIQVE